MFQYFNLNSPFLWKLAISSQITSSLNLYSSIRDIYTNFALSIALTLLTDGDNAPLYRGLIESGLGLDWVPQVHGMERGSRTTTFHVGLQGVRPGDDVERVEAVVMDILADTVKLGFPKVRIVLSILN